MTQPSHAWLEELPTRECVQLLDRSSLGRIAVLVDGHPEIFPVNHAFDVETGEVLFPTRAGTKLHAALHGPWVAFEIDGTDEDGIGWSVLVVGSADTGADPHQIARMTARRKATWAHREPAHWLKIRPAKITGRRLHPIDHAPRGAGSAK